MQRCALRIASRGRLTSFSVEYKTDNQSLFECAKSFTKQELRYHYTIFEGNMSSCRSLRGENHRRVCCDEVLGPMDPRDVIYTLRAHSTDYSSRRPHAHRKNACVQPTASSVTILVQVVLLLWVPVSSRTIRRHLAEGHL
ncbi:uncharacterized protein TNCV_2737731 [Trichonephila clavipes]|nr:uncharacterized protein TNCV_2737731 [Trichonephila clavipes]